MLSLIMPVDSGGGGGDYPLAIDSGVPCGEIMVRHGDNKN